MQARPLSCGVDVAMIGRSPQPARMPHLAFFALLGSSQAHASTLPQCALVPATGVWERVSGTVTPSPRSHGIWIYDPGRKVGVLFGGVDALGRRGDTWLWNGVRWLLQDSAGPSARVAAAATYSTRRQSVILHGGLGAGRRALSDTWEWAGSWTHRATTASPAPRFGHAMAYEHRAGAVVLTGGFVPDSIRSAGSPSWVGESTSEVWILTPDGWTPSVPLPGPGRYYHLMLSTLEDGVIVAGGANHGAGIEVTTSLTWAETGWNVAPSPIRARVLAAAAMDGRCAFAYGGTSYGRETEVWTDLWRFGAAWTALATSGLPDRRGAMLLFDSSRQELLLFGGTTSEGAPSADMWRLRLSTASSR